MRTFFLLLLVSLGVGCAVSLILWPLFWLLGIFQPPLFRTGRPVSKSLLLPAADACTGSPTSAIFFPHDLASQVAVKLICSALSEGMIRVPAANYVRPETSAANRAISVVYCP